MAAVPYALSVHHFIDKIGADAGFAAIIGVALVVIMLFVHARETARLRERAEDAEDRVGRLEAALEQVNRTVAATAHAVRSQQGAAGGAGLVSAPAAVRRLGARPVQTPAQRSGVTPAPALAGVASRTAAVPPGPAGPFAAFGTGAPALSSATHLIPLDRSAETEADDRSTAATGNGVAAPPAAAAAALSPATAAAGRTAPVAVAAPPAAAAAESPIGTTTASSTTTQATSRTPSNGASAAIGSSSIGRAPRRDYRSSDESGSRRGLVAIIGALVLVAIIVVAAVIVLTHHHSHSATRAAATHTHTSPAVKKQGKGRVAVDPSQVTVAVLNGTSTTNLAADVSQRLSKVGFKAGKTANFNNSDLTHTTIGFTPDHRAQALAVAKALKVKADQVLRVNGPTKALVCPAGTSCPDQVFVVLGSDLNSDA